MSLTDASLRHAGPAKYWVQERDKAWWVEMNSNSDWRYFTRQSPSGKTILIGQWGTSDSIICEMTENK